MDITQFTSAGAQSVAGAIREQLLEPFIAATCAALSEMAGIEVVVHNAYQTKSHALWGDINAVVGLQSQVTESLVLSFSNRTAAALAGRILAGATADVDENLIRDCVGEMGNVIAGQAKALLAGTPYHFVFSLPEVRMGAQAFQPEKDLDCLVVAFRSDQGEFALQLFLRPADASTPA